MRSTFFLAAASLGSGLASAQCQVYGIDIESGGTYFENSQLTVPFSLVQEFSGCDNDTANVRTNNPSSSIEILIKPPQNILVDPNGDQYECTDTPLTPDYTPETTPATGLSSSSPTTVTQTP